MASVFRRGRSPYYYCRFADGDRYIRRSTKERTQAAAQKVADRWEAEAWLKQSGTGDIRKEFLAWAAWRGIPELVVLKWLDERNGGQDEVLRLLRRIEGRLAELRAPFEPVLDLKGKMGR
jgi:hypothetical protein